MNDYRIESVGGGFVLIDDANEEVGSYGTEHEAINDLERCQKEDAMWETAKLIVDISRRTCRCMLWAARQRGTG